jgi:hypothetical protein
MIGFTEEARGIFACQLFEADFCRSVVDYLKKIDGWVAAQVLQEDELGGAASATMPDVRAASILSSFHAPGLYRDFDGQIDGVIKPFIRQVWRTDLAGHAGTQIIRYAPGGHYRPHKDAGRLMKERYFTVLCYLNGDFEGGQTQFPSLGYSAAPQAGKAILFPATYIHCAEPVIAGEKYVILTWIIGPVPIDWI